jgi:hypothetical protein
MEQEKKRLQRPGIEPGPLAWKASMLTSTLPMQMFLLRPYSSFTLLPGPYR